MLNKLPNIQSKLISGNKNSSSDDSDEDDDRPLVSDRRSEFLKTKQSFETPDKDGFTKVLGKPNKKQTKGDKRKEVSPIQGNKSKQTRS